MQPNKNSLIWFCDDIQLFGPRSSSRFIKYDRLSYIRHTYVCRYIKKGFHTVLFNPPIGWITPLLFQMTYVLWQDSLAIYIAQLVLLCLVLSIHACTNFKVTLNIAYLDADRHSHRQRIATISERPEAIK